MLSFDLPGWKIYQFYKEFKQVKKIITDRKILIFTCRSQEVKITGDGITNMPMCKTSIIHAIL